MLNIGPQELLIVLIIALVVVGPQRLPELGRTIGKALREFRKIQDDVKDTLKFDLDSDPEPYVRPTQTQRPPTQRLRWRPPGPHPRRRRRRSIPIREPRISRARPPA